MTKTRKSSSAPTRLEAVWLMDPAFRKIVAAITAAGGDVRAVGGAVRNALLKRPVTDIDLATTLHPLEVMRQAKASGLGAHATGIDHGTVTVVADGVPFEVTTLRRDVETDGRRAVVAFTEDWAEDARRRDFTINALYAAADGTLFDPVDGLADLEAHRVRFIGDAGERIREDYLRILRFFRFSAEYGAGPLDTAGIEACRLLKGGLKGLSGERIGAEMVKLVAAPRAGDVVRLMAETSVLESVLGPGITPDAFNRLVEIERTLDVAADPIVRLAALARDGLEGCDEFVSRLRLSNAQAETLRTATRDHAAYDPATPERDARVRLYQAGATIFRHGAQISWAKSNAATDDMGRVARVKLPDRWPVPEMPFRGADVIALGVPAGPRVGEILKLFEAWWIANDFTTDVDQQKARLAAFAQHG